jgi:YjbR
VVAIAGCMRRDLASCAGGRGPKTLVVSNGVGVDSDPLDDVGAFDRPANERARVNEHVEVPGHMVERISALCLGLPEVTVRIDHSRTRARSMARSFDVRKRSFCLLVAVEGPTGASVPLLVLRAAADERDALLSIGRPFFAPRARRDRIGVLLNKKTDWAEIRELVIESYRMLAPKKLIALLE